LTDKTKAVVSSGIQFIAADNATLDIPFLLKNMDEDNPPGFVSRRIDFDNAMAGLIDPQYATLLSDTLLEDIEQRDDGLMVTINQKGQRKTIFTKMIVGAEGRGSIVAKKMANHSMDAAHFSAGIRAYYQNVAGLHDQNFIELHFLKELQPGYLWIFPLPNGAANVGVGMLSKSISAKKVNLKQLMLEAIATHPNIKDRFADAVIEGGIEGWGLPLGSKKRPLSGNRFLLTGDAGSLIDPFTGEGIGNAMVSGLVAARVIKKAVDADNFSAAFLQQYDSDLYKKLWQNLSLAITCRSLAVSPACSILSSAKPAVVKNCGKPSAACLRMWTSEKNSPIPCLLKDIVQQVREFCELSFDESGKSIYQITFKSSIATEENPLA
jgi:flavin-dependent dehydrogenase